MKEQIKILIKLQEVEIEADHTLSFLTGMPERLEDLSNELSEFEQSLVAEDSLVEEMKKNYRNHESDAQLSLSQMKDRQDKLRAVKTNKEYQSVLKEIEELKEKNSQLEDKMIEFLDSIDEAEIKAAEKRKEYAELSKRIKSERTDIRKKIEEGEKKLARLDSERQTISKMIDPGLLNKFNVIKGKKGGLALVAVQDAICQGCHVNIPPQMYNEIQRLDSLRLCPNCQRMLYWETDSKRPE